jgi:molybdate transport system substrate-binding protein
MRRTASVILLVAVMAMAMAEAGCGSGSASSPSTQLSSAASGGTLNVFAAASLVNAFGKLRTIFQSAHPGWTVNLNLAGSDQLAAQIEQGAPCDVFAAASARFPQQLQSEGKLGPTRNFATNTLILVTPRSNPAHVGSVADLKNGAKLVVADPAVPLGTYTETVLGNLGITDSQLNIVSKEQDAESVLSKITLGEADAGFVYVTDALSQKAKLNEIQLPASAQATAIYPIGIIKGDRNARVAQQWIDLVTGRQGQAVLKSFGFGAAPSS